MGGFSTKLAWMALWAAVLVALGLFGYTSVVLIPSSLRERQQMRQMITDLEQRLQSNQTTIEHRKAYLHKLNTDPQFLEWVARERLRYAKPDEWILRFESNQVANPSAPGSPRQP